MNLERKISRRSGPCVSKIKSIKTKYSIISPQDIESLSSFRNLATFDQPSQCYPASIEPANFNPTRDIETPITRRNNKKQTDRGNHSGGGHPVKRAVTREIFIPRPELFNSIVDRRPRYENTLPLVHYSRHEQLSNLIPVYTTRGEMENDMIFDVNFYSVLLREERMSWSIFPRSHVCNIAHRDHRRSSKRIGRFPVNGRRLMAMPCRVADRRSHLPHNFSLVSLILLLPFFSLVSNSNNLILS